VKIEDRFREAGLRECDEIARGDPLDAARRWRCPDCVRAAVAAIEARTAATGQRP